MNRLEALGQLPPLSPNLRNRLEHTLGLARDYLLSRQSPGGGFCAYRGFHLEEPNLTDTWLGIAAWRHLTRAPVPHRVEHAEFVIQRDITAQPVLLYERVQVLRLLEMADPRAAQVRQAVSALPVRLPERDLPSLQAPLRQLRQTIQLKQLFGSQDDAQVRVIAELVQGWEAPDGGYGRPPNLLDTADVLALLHACGRPLGGVTLDFVRRMELPSFGYRLTATSLSPSLEIACAGLSCCRLLAIEPTYTEDAIGFILKCQGQTGGFALRPDAKPSLDLTHLALCTLFPGGDSDLL